MKINYLVIIFLLVTLQIQAITVKGRILDGSNKEPLVGATIINKYNNKMHQLAGLDGSFALHNVTKGKQIFVIQYMGYKAQEKEIEVVDEKNVVNVEILLVSNSVNLNQVEVVANADKDSKENAIRAEKESPQLLNIISSKAIQISPDVSVAQVLQRMSGVTVQKTSNSGDGQYAIIRGMDKRYNYTLINGIKIPSPEDKNRYVPMDIFPAELMSRVEVIKALTPDMEGDAIGGAMNLVFKDAPDKLEIKVNGAMGYNQLFLDRPFYSYNSKVVNLNSPAEINGTYYPAQRNDFPIENLKQKAIHPGPNFTGGFTIGDRFLNGKLGVIFAVSNQNTYSGSNSFFASPKAQPNEGNQAAFETSQIRTYSTLQNRLGFHNKFDFVFDKSNKISLYNMYFKLDKYNARSTTETSLATGVGNVMTKQRTQTQLQDIYSSSFQGKHTLFQTLTLDWIGAFSKAMANTPDDASFNYNSTKVDNKVLQGMSRKWKKTTDQDLSGYINLMWQPEFFGKKLELKAGGMFRHKTRENYYNDYSLDPTPPLNNTNQLFTSVDSMKYNFPNSGSPINQNDYMVTEDIMAFYGQAKITLWQKLQVLAGLRVEQTKSNYALKQTRTTPNLEMPLDFPGQNGSRAYSDMLPSVHLKYAINTTQNLRWSYFGSISRPGFFEVIPYYLSEGDDEESDYDSKGNPQLKRAKAQNIDFRYEVFPRPSEQFLLGIFYKNIKDPIEYGLVRENGPSNLQLKPQNYGTATNYGFEFVGTKYFNEFGVSANYTYTKSSITTSKGNYHRNDKGQLVTDSLLQTRPMQGQADHIANLSLLYKNQKIGLDMQLSGVYTGKYISQVSAYYGLDYWSMPVTTLDFSFEWKLTNKLNLSVFGKARNLLNTTPVIRILQNNPYLTGTFALPNQDSSGSIVVRKGENRQNYLLGIRYSF
jgi:Outer membrane receptor proteins, mostly Fe transport